MKKNEWKETIYVLVLQGMMDKARKERHAIITELGLKDDAFILIEGDITQPSLMISDETQEILNNRVPCFPSCSYL